MNLSDIVDPGDGGANLTPMIDMVFQLIIFFVIVNDFSSTQMEKVVLPKAMVADTAKSPVPERVVFVNVLPNGDIKINHHKYGGDGVDDSVLKDYLQVEAQMAGTEPNPEGSGGKPVSKLRVIIRADRHARYQYVQKVMKSCALNGIFRTVINAFKEPLDQMN
ncbi:ExbD/TolR family protein [Planctomycetota bacterium]